LAGVIAEVAHDLIATGVAVRVAGERHSREAVVAGGREQPHRVPASAPRGCWRLSGLKDRKPSSLLSKEIPDRQAGLAPSNHDHIAAFCHYVHRNSLTLSALKPDELLR